MWDATSSSIHRRQKKMETFAFLKGLAQMRLFHCVWISSLVILGLLLTSTNLSNKDVSKTLNARNVGKNLNDAVRAAGVIADGQFDGDTWSSNTSVGSLKVSYRAWDSSGGCKAYRKKHPLEIRRPSSQIRSIQEATHKDCTKLRKRHVSILVKGYTWIPDNLNNLYSCGCGLTCLWTNFDVLADKPDAHLYETIAPPLSRQKGEPWRVYMDLEPGRNKAQSQDLFVSYHAEDDLQVTYAGASFHMIRNYYISPEKHNDVLVYWSSSRCVDERQRIASELLPLLSHHSFGKCLNNVGGLDMILKLYPKCSQGSGGGPAWGQNLHCAMSHYKFVLAIENTRTESYVTEKLYYALDVGAIPIYFGAPNVRDFVPPHSFIDGYQFQNIQELADYVKKVAADPLLYAEYHGWRRCGVMGNYGLARAISLDSMPCRLCTKISQLGGRQA